MNSCRLVVDGRDLEVTRAAPNVREITSGGLPRGNRLSPRIGLEIVDSSTWTLRFHDHGRRRRR